MKKKRRKKKQTVFISIQFKVVLMYFRCGVDIEMQSKERFSINYYYKTYMKKEKYSHLDHSITHLKENHKYLKRKKKNEGK